MHLSCYNNYMKTSYRCPICKKSMDANLAADYFKLIDNQISHQPMPRTLQNLTCKITCMDCTETSSSIFHKLGVKCGGCGSYNTIRADL